ncbi:MAG: hypothetical protein V3S64_00205 [bacterium]
MEHILEFLAKEWSIIISAPFTFLVFLVVSASVTQKLWKWYYGKHLADKEGTIELLREQVKLEKAVLEKNLNDALFYQEVLESNIKTVEIEYEKVLRQFTKLKEDGQYDSNED